MLRIRIRLPKGKSAAYRHLDLLHDALVNAWAAAGAAPEHVVGAQARPWNFAALGRHRGREGQVHTLVVSTPDRDLSSYLAAFEPHEVCQARASTGELVSFESADISLEGDPIPPGEGALSCLLLSPLAVSSREGQQRRWLKDLRNLDLPSIINRRLSRIAGRPVYLRAQADSLYVRANPDHSVLVSLKRSRNGHHAFVIGMQAPLVLAGAEDDLRLAWYAGIGEKTRNGCGCLGLLERGVGR